MEGKISSNKYSNFIAALFINFGVMILAFVGLGTITLNNLIILPSLFFVEIGYIIVAKKVIERISLKIFIVGDELQVLKHDYKFTIPVMKIRKIKLEHGNAGRSRPYRIEFLDDENELRSLSFYVARWNRDFVRFIAFVAEHNPYAKIEQYALPWER